ncbi:family 16 glycosylhydrolase [Flavobacterium sp.]|uniref:family 16 glycosylhydrolase n=1 Tax=Flavobacterium sp. TaxID=239 RepID=UPI003C3752FE
MKKLASLLLIIMISITSCSKDSDPAETVILKPTPTPTPTPEITDWRLIPVPADAGTGNKWEFQEDVSDDFEYNFAATASKTTFGTNGKWTNFYHNAWDGPGLTKWTYENVSVADGLLQLKTTRVDGETKSYDYGGNTLTGKATRLGAVYSNKQIQYPVYIESRIKIANTVCTSGAWMLSPDDTQEIDFMEAWGGKATRNNVAGGRQFSKTIHLSHHVFIRSPFEDYQPADATTWYTDSKVGDWTNEYHRYGVYWKSPTELEYYIDGKLVRSTNNLDSSGGKDGIDPKSFTSPTKEKTTRTGLNKAMDILITMEDQNWRAGIGCTPTDEEIKDIDGNTMKIDWIRILKPVTK